jgi:hypothetical protein
MKIFKLVVKITMARSCARKQHLELTRVGSEAWTMDLGLWTVDHAEPQSFNQM